MQTIVNVQVRMDPKLYQTLKRLAGKNGSMSLNKLINEALGQYILTNIDNT